MSEERAGAGSDDAVERIEQALASLRRGGRPQWRGPHEGPGGRGGPFVGGGPHDHGRPREHVGELGHDRRHGRGAPFGRGGPRGPWEFRVGPVARARLLAALDSEDRLMSVTELAEAIGVDQPRASRLVQSAVGEGLVVREADPDDARRTRLRITDEGRAAVRAATSDRRRAIESALDGFSDDERERFADLLGRFADGLRRAHPPHP
ncbi:MarR family winged helix-turn-helix transcriptional regulator [Agromyces sp. ZXT2-6]|uniref:MarR family winged helix-turn-helix transcriptional regulator n=1 Tax=Agromyces sp. ZXT2-6 TaxID=3461153 RepID=UPI004054FF20